MREAWCFCSLNGLRDHRSKCYQFIFSKKDNKFLRERHSVFPAISRALIIGEKNDNNVISRNNIEIDQKMSSI